MIEPATFTPDSMQNKIELKKFSAKELIFNTDETIEILNFFFKAHARLINQISVTNSVREFAQGLLVEAIDTSYEIGYIESIFRAAANPHAAFRSVIQKLANSSSTHWFKHATLRDLREGKIYDFVTNELSVRFIHKLTFYSNGDAHNRLGRTAYQIAFAQKTGQSEKG